MQANFLQLNCDKSDIIISCPKFFTKATHNFCFIIDNYAMSPCSHMPNQGVIFNSNLPRSTLLSGERPTVETVRPWHWMLPASTILLHLPDVAEQDNAPWPGAFWRPSGTQTRPPGEVWCWLAIQKPAPQMSSACPHIRQLVFIRYFPAMLTDTIRTIGKWWSGWWMSG